MPVAITFQAPATKEQVMEVYYETGPYRYLPEIEAGEPIDGQPTIYIHCPDPDYFYWAQNFAAALEERLPRISECLFCGHQWIEQPDEDAEECPSCGESFEGDD